MTSQPATNKLTTENFGSQVPTDNEDVSVDKKQPFASNPSTPSDISNSISVNSPCTQDKQQSQHHQEPQDLKTENPVITNSNQKRLHPFVHWAQSQTSISLRVDLIQVENLDVSIGEDGASLTFFAQGRGAHGLQDYYFSLDFHSTVERKFDCHAIERYVLILIKKTPDRQINWPRLTKQTSKLPWLRVDFDRYGGDDSDEDNSNNDDEQHQLDEGRQSFELLREQLKEAKQQQQQQTNSTTENINDQSQQQNSWADSLDNIFKNKNKNNKFDIFDPFNKRNKFRDTANMKYDYRKDSVTTTDSGKNTAKHALDYKKTYLFIYNLVMFIIFLKVNLVLIIKSISGTVDDDIVQGAAFIVKLLTWTQLLETIHPILGLVPGGPLMPFTQVVGRLLVNYFLSEPTIRIDSAPYACYLFIVWSSIEVFRYSFYSLRVFNVNIYALKWCRYTLFLPLYPMGGLCESMVLFSTIKHYETTGAYSVNLPNSANISFSLPVVLRVYIFGLLFPTIYYLMRYMWTQRRKQLKEKLA